MPFWVWLDHPDVAHLKPCGSHWRSSSVASQRSLLPAHQPHRSRSCDLRPGSSSANCCVWKEASVDERETRPPDCCRGKCHPCQLACYPPTSEAEEGKKKKHLMTVIQQTLHCSFKPQARNVYYDHAWMGERFTQINCPSFVSAVWKQMPPCTSPRETVSQGQWRHPISPPPSHIWFNRDRCRPQTGLLQKCGQVVNTQTWRGRAALQTGLISSGLSWAADGGGGGGHRSADLGSFYSLLVRHLLLSRQQRCHLGRTDITESPTLKEASQWTQRQTNIPGGWNAGKQLRPSNLLIAHISVEP